MDKAIPRNHSPILGLYCNAFGHDYLVTQNRKDQINEYKCVCCGKQANLEQLFDKA